MKSMIKNLTFMVMLSFITMLCQAQWIKISDGSNKTEFKVLESSEKGAVITANVNAYGLKSVSTENGVASIVSIEDGTFRQEKSAPDVMFLTRSLHIPDKGKMRVEIVSSEYKDIKGFEMAPSQGPVSRSQPKSSYPREKGPVYKQNAFYPSEIAELGEAYNIREERGQTLKLNITRYNPATKVLRVYTKLTVRVVPTGEKGVNEINNPGKGMAPVFEKVVKQHFDVNMSGKNEKYSILPDGDKMLVVCYSSFMSTMEPFVDWKNSIGIQTEIVNYSDIGSSSALKTYVSNYYNQNGLSYLLLVGDHQYVPSSSTSAGDSDNNYGYIVGSDHYLDIFVGRFSATNTTEVNTMVDRILYYERDASSSDSYITKGLGIASNECCGDDNESDEAHMNNIESDLEYYGYSITRQYQDGGSAAGISSTINSGTGIINYVGHGSQTSWSAPYFSSSNVNSLTNTNKFPFIITVACVVGDFTGATCFAESWIRASSGGEPTGAVVFCGSTINQSWNSPMCAQDEMNDLLVANSLIRYAPIFVNGMFQMIDEYGSDGENMADTWTIFGDPSVQMRTPGHPNGPDGGSTNEPPTVSITSPFDGATFDEGDNITINATASDNDGSVAQVEFFSNGSLLGTDTSTPYSYAMNSVAAGTYSLTAKATDNEGATKTSSAVNITVNEVVPPEYCSLTATDQGYEWITEVQIGTFSNTSGKENDGYSNFTSQTIPMITGDNDITLTPNTTSYTEYFTVWIDYNNDLDFADSGEQVLTGSASGNTTGTINVPTSASGTTRMRIAMQYNSSLTDPCGSYQYGEVEDYTVSFSGTSSVLTSIEVSPSTATIDLNGTQQFSAQGKDQNGDNMDATITWSASGGSINTSGLFTGSAAGTFTVTATSGSVSGIATVTVTDEDPVPYCTSSGTDQGYEWITGVTIGSFTKTSGKENDGYSDFTSETINLTAGSSVSATLTPNTTQYTEYFTVWIDYNGDGDFEDTGEEVLSGSAKGNTTGTISVPSSASGTTRMRVSMQYYSALNSSCGTFQYGEVEDYTVNISGAAKSAITDASIVIKIAPNPTDGIIYIKTNINGPYKILITDISGQIVMKLIGEGELTVVDMSKLSDGVYLVNVGDQVTKVIKK